MSKKTIILGMNRSYSLIYEIEKNLNFLGFEVYVISVNNSFTYKNKFQKIINYLAKKIFKSIEIERKLKLEPNLKEFDEKINQLNAKIDYALFVRCDSFPISFIKRIKKITHKTIAYQWDGLHLFPDAIKRIKFFDRYFVFDGKDLKVDPRILPTTNFYFDYDQNSYEDEVIDKSIYFFGTYINFRMDIIHRLAGKIKEIGFLPDINILAYSRDNIEKYKGSEIKFLKEGISFEKNIQNARKASVLVDFVNGKHNGLSFRTFEAIGYQKKLITTNSEIIHYDFYHPNNFFVLNENNLDQLEEFLLKPYVKLDETIRRKYSFTNWIKYVLDIEPHQKITLPH